MNRVWLDLGSNIDREQSIRAAVDLLKQYLPVTRSSHVYETTPVGYTDQPNFYNLCLELETELSGGEIAALLHQLEDRLGRVRTENKFGPRNIDMDVVLHENTNKAHPQVEREVFVLVPLCELVPDFIHPERGLALSELLAGISINPGEIQRIKLPGFPLKRED
jgi:2-amino-4-hydroxy-6-hydroxymethyldihydropteridine diphosphokinase